MHIADQESGNLGANAIVGGSAGIATGAAMSIKMRGTDQVAVCFFGDGALGQGLLYEVMNMAQLWKYPIIYVCENNLYNEYTHHSETTAGEMTARPQAFGIHTVEVDGQDVRAVYQAMTDLVAGRRAGEGPAFLLCHTYRFLGHHVGDIDRAYYRPKEEEEEWRTNRDPLKLLSEWLINEKHAEAAMFDQINQEVTAEVAKLYGDEPLEFGPDYLIPKPFDPRLITELPIAVAKAAMDSGVATRPIEDFQQYRDELERYVYKSGQLMRPIYTKASHHPKRVALAEGEEFKVLRAAQTMVDDHIAFPVLIGRESVILDRIEKLGLRLTRDKDYELVNTESDPRYNDYWYTYYELMSRKGIAPDTAKKIIRTSSSAIAAVMVHKGHADAMICGTVGRYRKHLRTVRDVIGLREGATTLAALNVLILSKGTYFVSDAYVNSHPSAEQISETAILAAEEVERFGLEPKIALLSHSEFGSQEGNAEVTKMQVATRLIKEKAPHLNIDGEMNADSALCEEIRNIVFPDSDLKGDANLLIMPSLDAANISFNMLKVLGDGIVVGPLLMGAAKPAHILTPSVTSRGIVNVAALASVAAGMEEAA